MDRTIDNVRTLLQILVSLHGGTNPTLQELRNDEYLRGQMDLFCDFACVSEISEILEEDLVTACLIAAHGGNPGAFVKKVLVCVQAWWDQRPDFFLDQVSA